LPYTNVTAGCSAKDFLDFGEELGGLEVGHVVRPNV
jgi:hypothetical protein